jgi:hypothetical protein
MALTLRSLIEPTQIYFGRDVQDKSWTPSLRSPKFILDETSKINLGLLINMLLFHILKYLCLRECAGAWEPERNPIPSSLGTKGRQAF